MLYCNNRLFKKVRSHKIGKKKMPPLFQQFVDKIEPLYDLTILAVEYDSIDIGPHEGRPRLNLIFEDQKSSDNIHKDRWTIKPHVKNRILKIFAEAVHDFQEIEAYPTENIHLISDVFEDEAKNRAALELIERKGKKLEEQFLEYGVWTITGMSKNIVVFFTDEKTKHQNMKNGICDLIRHELFKKIKPYDEFTYFSEDSLEIHYDSKENLDDNYEGSLFYYFR